MRTSKPIDGRPRWRGALWACACACGLLLAACVGGKVEPAYVVATGGDAERGEQVLDAAPCGSCHTIPGIKGADGKIAPPLNFFAQRTFIAGAVPNSPEYLVQWILDPQSIEPGTAMPSVGLSPEQARDVAAYLYTLR